MKEVNTVVVSRQWHNPKISVQVTMQGIGISIDLDDFLVALSQQYGNPTSTVTAAQHLARLRVAAAAVDAGMKLVTTQAMSQASK